MNDDLMLLEDLSDVIRTAEESGVFLKDENSGHRFAHLLKGIITYWAEYEPDGGGYRVYNVYQHRVNIKNDPGMD